MKELYAGAGKAIIDFPDDIFPFVEGKDTWTGIHDSPCARAVILRTEQSFLYISVEVVILDKELAAELKKESSRITGIDEDSIWISATHTVTMPHMFERDQPGEGEDNLAFRMKKMVLNAALAAVLNAQNSIEPSRIGYGEGCCSVNANRMINTCDGWWIGCAEESPTDHSVPVIRIENLMGIPTIILYSYACELSVMDNSVMKDGGRHMTGDLEGIASGLIEKAFGGGLVAAFLPGPCSEQGPVYKAVRTLRGIGGSYYTEDLHDDAWLLLQMAGERLSEQVIIAAENVKCDITSPEISLHCETFSFPGQKLKGLPNPLRTPLKDWKSIPDSDRTRSIEVLRVGSIVIVSIGGLGVVNADVIKKNSRFEHTIVMEGVTGRAKPLPTDGAKAMADARSYDLGTVQAKNSEFARGAAEKMVSNVIDMLTALAESD